MAAAYLNGPPSRPTPLIDHWCEGKQPFESAVLAMEVVKRTEGKRGPRHLYRCRKCGSFHIGTQKSRMEVPSRAVQATLIRQR